MESDHNIPIFIESQEPPAKSEDPDRVFFYLLFTVVFD
jgi:hypothetical protein